MDIKQKIIDSANGNPVFLCYWYSKIDNKVKLEQTPIITNEATVTIDEIQNSKYFLIFAVDPAAAVYNITITEALKSMILHSASVPSSSLFGEH